MSWRLIWLCLPGLIWTVCTSPALGQETAPVPSPTDTAATPAVPLTDVPAGLAPTPGAPALGAPTAARSTEIFPDTSNGTKFYTITASLREEYDDNIYTTRSNKVGSPVTEISPSILFNVPMDNSTFSARLTFGADYYEHRKGDVLDLTAEVLLNYTHQFSNRFSLSLADQGGYFTEPDLLNAVGTPFRDGSYFENTFTGDYDAQWTPLFGTSTSYSNVAILYDNEEIARSQNEDENTLSNDFRFAVYPKYNLTAGFIVDDIEYFQDNRGYTNSTLDVGLDWQALDSLTVAVRGGGSYTVGDGTPDSVSPYASANVDWHLGKRSDLSVNYVHTVQPTDVVNAVGQEVDRVSIRFSYDITARINAHAAGTFTYATYTNQLLKTGSSFTEQDVGLDLGLNYRINGNFSVETGYFLSDISSEEEERDYTRNQVYLGIRGTY